MHIQIFAWTNKTNLWRRKKGKEEAAEYHVRKCSAVASAHGQLSPQMHHPRAFWTCVESWYTLCTWGSSVLQQTHWSTLALSVIPTSTRVSCLICCSNGKLPYTYHYWLVLVQVRYFLKPFGILRGRISLYNLICGITLIKYIPLKWYLHDQDPNIAKNIRLSPWNILICNLLT